MSSSVVSFPKREWASAQQGSRVRGGVMTAYPVGIGCVFDWHARSLAVVNGLDVLRREVAHVSMATAPPAQRVGAVNEFDDVTAQEA